MQLSLFTVALFASVASARQFILYEKANWYPPSHYEDRPNDGTCWNLNGKGDQASSVGSGSPGCTTFYRERDCTGSSWQFRESAPTVPSFLNDHIYSYRNQC